MPTEREVDARAFLTAQRGGQPLTLGAFLRAIRLGEGATLETFAAQLGETKPHLSDIEHGRRSVSVERAATWAKRLGYHAGQFVQLALQAQVAAERLPLVVTVAVAPARQRRAAQASAWCGVSARRPRVAAKTKPRSRRTRSARPER